jgi:hypothetical protein
MKTVISSLLNDLGTAAPIVIVGGGILGLYQAGARVYHHTVGSRRDLARRLNQLAAGVTVRYVEERFGTPAFARTIVLPRGLPETPEAARPRRRTVRELARILSDASATASSDPATPVAANAPGRAVGGGRSFRELVYREKHAWVQVLVDENDAVARFSITVTDPKFKFSIRDLTWGHLAVRLGHSRFADVLPGLPLDGRSLRIGAHNHEYAEAYWFGNPGNYQHYVISSNEIGTGDFGFSILRQGPSWHRAGTLALDNPLPADQPEFDPDASYAGRFRAETTINTLTVLGPGRQPADLAEPRGPDSNHVRVLVPGRRERQQIRRRLRRANREMLRNNRRLPPSQALDGTAPSPAATE